MLASCAEPRHSGCNSWMIWKKMISTIVNESLSNNFINCNCNIKWVTTHGNSYSKNMLASCAEPTTFRLQQLDDLEEDDFDYCE
ncbi:hypothetical protein CEXT_26011 [Caerostris extrusa]|uniref:Uncharacterized protein n=1 Tax=Caerostris extrusa TaxID=172846 RepID=A0AAV4YAG6_CAEEX|nr:hypothetical protein CEXT_26011 [Caerostris extrusa]